MNCSKNRPKFNGVLVIFSSARNFPLSFIATRVIFRLCKSIPMWIMTSSLVCLCGNYNVGGDVLFVKIKRFKRTLLCAFGFGEQANKFINFSYIHAGLAA